MPPTVRATRILNALTPAVRRHNVTLRNGRVRGHLGFGTAVDVYTTNKNQKHACGTRRVRVSNERPVGPAPPKD